MPAFKTKAEVAALALPDRSAARPTPRKAAALGPPKPKQKLIRDGFTIPKPEYLVLESLKVRAAALARPTKKSEVLRAGIAALAKMSDRSFLAALNAIESIKTGRPKKHPEA